jgi:hypothetical protein
MKFRLKKVNTLAFEKSHNISLYLLFEQGICRNPPVPPFEKGGRRGDFRRPFQKAKFLRKKKGKEQHDISEENSRMQQRTRAVAAHAGASHCHQDVEEPG